jgi:hypothetical protein
MEVGVNEPGLVGWVMFRAILFFGLTTLALASETLDALVTAAARFSAAIQQQLEMLQNDPSPGEIAEKTIQHAEAKATYFEALRAELPELMKIATGKQARPPELDTFAAAFAIAGEEQEKVADQETLVLLKRFARDPDVEKAMVKFDRAQRVEQAFHKEFDGRDFAGR